MNGGIRDILRRSYNKGTYDIVKKGLLDYKEQLR